MRNLGRWGAKGGNSAKVQTEPPLKVLWDFYVVCLNSPYNLTRMATIFGWRLNTV